FPAHLRIDGVGGREYAARAGRQGSSAPGAWRRCGAGVLLFCRADVLRRANGVWNRERRRRRLSGPVRNPPCWRGGGLGAAPVRDGVARLALLSVLRVLLLGQRAPKHGRRAAPRPELPPDAGGGGR